MKTVAVIVWMFYGLGGHATSPGVDQIATQLRHTPGVFVRGPYSYESWRKVAANIKKAPANTTKVIVGYSCGVGATAWAAARAGVPIAKVVGIQGSVYCPPTPLTKNVAAAFEIYNPVCMETVGLGCAKYQSGPSFHGVIHYISREVSHGQADLDPITQKDVISEIKELAPEPVPHE